MSWLLAVSVSTILATSLILVPAGNASVLDTTTPVLSSFSLSAAVISPSQPVTFSYVATEDSGSLSKLELSYRDHYGHRDTLTFQGPLADSGSLTINVPDTWRDGEWILDGIYLTDPSGNQIRYFGGGTATLSPVGATGPTTHAIPFVPGKLTVSGSTVDVTVPSLTSISTTGSPAAPGDTISVHYAATDASGGLRIAMWFRDAIGLEHLITTTATGQLPLTGSIEQTIPATWPNGTYQLVRMNLLDVFENRGTYRDNGTVLLYPAGTKGPTSHTVDFQPAAFTVSGSAADFTPPALTSVKLTGSPVPLGGAATLSYTAQSQDPLTVVKLTYADPTGVPLTFTATPAQLSGTVPVVVPAGGLTGTYSLETILLTDSAGNSITYNRSGGTVQSPGGLLGTHTIAMNAADLLAVTPPTVPSAPGMDYVRARSRSALVTWNPSDPHGSPITRYTVTAQPGGRTVTTNGSAGKVEMTGLTNEVTYRFSVTATNAVGTGPASLSSAAVTPKMSTNLLGTGDFSGDGRADLLGVRSPADGYRSTSLYRGNGLGGFASSGAVSHYYEVQDRIILPVGLFDDYRLPNILIVDDWGYLLSERGDGHGGFPSSRVIVGRGWGVMRTVFGAGDFSGDGRSDVMAVRGDGGLYLYRGDGHGHLVAGQRVGNGWAGFLTVFSPGDFSGDGKSDLMAVSKDGGLYLYRGNGRGGFASAGQRIGNGWGQFISVISTGDFSGDRKSDVMAVNDAGALVLYRGNGLGGWAAAGKSIGSGWAIFR